MPAIIRRLSAAPDLGPTMGAIYVGAMVAGMYASVAFVVSFPFEFILQIIWIHQRSDFSVFQELLLSRYDVLQIWGE